MVARMVMELFGGGVAAWVVWDRFHGTNEYQPITANTTNTSNACGRSSMVSGCLHTIVNPEVPKLGTKTIVHKWADSFLIFSGKIDGQRNTPLSYVLRESDIVPTALVRLDC